jgi:hypothetical protein
MGRSFAGEILVGLALPAIAAVVKIWIAYRITVARERALTDRVKAVLADTLPEQRPELLRAHGDLEAHARPPDPPGLFTRLVIRGERP